MVPANPSARDALPDNATWAARHGEFALILALFLLMRWMLALWVKPWVSEFEMSHFPRMALSEWGVLPFVHYWLEYPPVFPYVALLAYKAAALFTGSPLAGQAQAASCEYLFGTVLRMTFMLVDGANLVLIYLLALRVHGKRRAIRLCWVYACLFTPLFVALGFFDGFVLFWMLLGVWCAVQQRGGLCGAALGIGAMAKFVPIALLPAALKYLGTGGRRAQCVAWFVLVCAFVLAPFTWVRPDLMRAGFESSARRMPWGTVWAMMAGNYHFGSVDPPPRFAAVCRGVIREAQALAPSREAGPDPIREGLRRLVRKEAITDAECRATWREVWRAKRRHRKLGPDLSERYQRAAALVLVRSGVDTGSVSHVNAIGVVTERLDLASLQEDRMMGRLCSDVSYLESPSAGRAYAGIGVAVLILVAWAWWRANPAPGAQNALLLAAAMLCVFLVYSKGWSPQFAVYPMAFALLCFPGRRGIGLALAIGALAFLEMPIWLRFLYVRVQGSRPAAPYVLGACIIARTAVLCWMGWSAWACLQRRARRA